MRESPPARSDRVITHRFRACSHGDRRAAHLLSFGIALGRRRLRLALRGLLLGLRMLSHLRPTAAAIAPRFTECGRAELPAAASVWSRARATKPTLLSDRCLRAQVAVATSAPASGSPPWTVVGTGRAMARLGSARLGLRSSCLHKVSALSSLACNSEQHWLCPSMHCGAFLGAVVHVCLGAFRSVSASAAPSAASSTRTADSTTSAATPCRFGHTSPPRPSVRPPPCSERTAGLSRPRAAGSAGGPSFRNGLAYAGSGEMGNMG